MQEILDDFERRDWEERSPDGTVRLAVVGLGEFARTQALPGIADADYCTATVAVSGSPEKAESLVEDGRVDRALSYDEYHDGAAADAYDAVYVATPTGRHLSYVETAADLGKDVICEKPLESSVERGQRLVDACDDAGVTLMVAYRPRAEPAFRRVRELISAGAIGEPTRYSGAFSFRVLELGGPDQWRIDPDLAGGGALMDAGVYLANTSRFLLDDDPVAATGVTASEGAAFEGVDERASFTLSFPDGVTAACETSFRDYRDDRIRITGTEGTLTIDPAFWFKESRTVTVERDGGTVTVEGPNVDEVTEEFDLFAYRLLTGEEPAVDGEVGVTDLEVLSGVYDAAENGERVDLRR